MTSAARCAPRLSSTTVWPLFRQGMRSSLQKESKDVLVRARFDGDHGNDAGGGHRADERCHATTVSGYELANGLTFEGAPSHPRHRGVNTGLIQEDQVFEVCLGLPFIDEGPAKLLYSGAFGLYRPERLFLT
jgi:hypothetical protein